MIAQHVHTVPAPPPRIAMSRSLTTGAAGAVFIGGVALASAFARGDTPLAWSAYFIGAFFALGLGIFGLVWLAILYLAGGTWAVSMRRIPEAMTTWLVPGSALAMVVLAGADSLYEWFRPATVAADETLAHKAPFLNPTMFVALVAVSLLLWIAFAAIMVRASHRQDRAGGMSATRSSRAISPVFLILFALTFSIVSFYLLLSLDAHWFSTMFAVLVFTDVMQTGTAFLAVVAGLLLASGTLQGFLNEEHLHNVGKMLFAWTGFWAYIYFCQFMLIWYANLPEETAYYLRRADHGWFPYLLLLPALKFAVPFLLLIPREAKRNSRKLVSIALLILFAQFWELYVMVGPAIGVGEVASPAHVPVIELASTVGFAGLFTLVFGWSLSRHDAVPLKDPGLLECLQYHG